MPTPTKRTNERPSSSVEAATLKLVKLKGVDVAADFLGLTVETTLRIASGEPARHASIELARLKLGVKEE
jgi:hypothetical protein